MRRYENVRIEKLKPYKNNARTHSDRQIEKIADSIREFGFINPVLIDGNYGIIAGHGRVKGAERLGMVEVPCLFIEDLTEEQKRAYILADNKLALDAGWDRELLKLELEELDGLDFDITLTGFDLDVIFDDEDGYYGDERERTNKEYNLDIVDHGNLSNDFWQMPIIKNDNYIPDDLIGFNYAKTSENKNTGIHFYLDDYQFERLWNAPEKYLDVLSKYECILTPDFSLYMDMPMPMKIWNVYRSRQIGAYYQARGIKVIPTVSWAEAETFEFCFLGIPKGSVVSVSTIGVKQDEEALRIWNDGMREMIRQTEPSAILVYGGKLDFDYGGTEVIYFDNKVIKNWSGKK
nr:MAG TPA: ParB protein [Caudoviricetes sp.]